MDYSWLLAAISAGFGALFGGVVFRRVDISRVSYREAKQMLSAMICSVSRRLEQNEALTRELSEQLQILSANQGRLNAEGQNADKERLLGFMHDWIGSMKRVIDKVDVLQKNIKSVEQEVDAVRVRVHQLSSARQQRPGTSVATVGVVTQDTVANLSPTQKQVLELLVAGPKAAPEIGRLVSKSREHAARLMKSLFEQGFVEREANRQPYEYRLNDKLREVVARVGHEEPSQFAR